MITLSPFDRQLHRALVERATEADPLDPHASCLSYGALGRAVDPDGADPEYTRPPFHPMLPALGRVSEYEAEHGRPMLSALVVSDAGGEPGSGFAQLARDLGREVSDEEAFWRSEVDAVVAFWAARHPVLLLDSVVGSLKAELAAAREALDGMEDRPGGAGTGSTAAHVDPRAGFQFVPPPGWRVVSGDADDSVTSLYYPPSAGTADDEVARAAREEKRLWDEATSPVGAPPVDPLDDDDDDDMDDDMSALPFSQLGIRVGRLDGLQEELRESPGEDGLVELATSLATYLRPLEYFTAGAGYGDERSVHRLTASGRPAAAVRWRFLADEEGATAVYLRLLVVQFSDGTLSYISGVAQTETDQRLVDDCLDSVEPLAAGPAGRPRA